MVCKSILGHFLLFEGQNPSNLHVFQKILLELGMELHFDPTQKHKYLLPNTQPEMGRVLSQLWYLPTSKTVLSDFKARHLIKMLKNSVAMENLMF